MTEAEIIRLLERHAECIVSEIMSPIETRIRKQSDTLDALIMKWASTIHSVDSRQRKLKLEFTKLKNDIHHHIKSIQDELILHKEDNINLEENVLEKVQERISKAIQYGEEIEALHKKTQELCKIDYSQIENHFAMFIQNAKIGIKDAADLRIIDILNLEKKFKELVRLADKSLRKHQLYRNVEEPTTIIL